MAQDAAADAVALAKKLANPIAPLTSVPLQYNSDSGYGPTGVALKQVGPWTYGALANHVWTVFGDDSREKVNATFLQPFVAIVTPTKTTFSLNTESTYDWEAGEWSVPVNAAVSQMLKLGPQILQLQVGARYWVDSPPGGPDGWGLRLGVTLLYPKK